MFCAVHHSQDWPAWFPFLRKLLELPSYLQIPECSDAGNASQPWMVAVHVALPPARVAPWPSHRAMRACGLNGTPAPLLAAGVMAPAGNATNGAKLFKAKCATCHTCNEGGPNKQGRTDFLSSTNR